MEHPGMVPGIPGYYISILGSTGSIQDRPRELSGMGHPGIVPGIMIPGYPKTTWDKLWQYRTCVTYIQHTYVQHVPVGLGRLCSILYLQLYYAISLCSKFYRLCPKFVDYAPNLSIMLGKEQTCMFK